MGVVRCLTFNIWKNEGDFPARMAAIGRLLRDHRPDVVALQECFVAPGLGIDPALTLAEAGEGYHLTRFPARAKPRWHDGAWHDSRSDMVILSQAAPVAWGAVPLPPDPRDGERGLLWVDLALAGCTVRVGCTHLTHLHDAAAEAIRTKQAAALLRALRAGPDVAVLMGDLNADSDSAALAPVFSHPALCPAAQWFARPPAGKVPDNGAIDHVLLFAPAGAAHMVSRSILARPDPFGSPSDHPAILAEIAITGGAHLNCLAELPD